MIMHHEPKQYKKLCASKAAYISSHPVLKQKFLAGVFENTSCGFVNVADYNSLGGREGVIAKCKNDARQIRRYNTAGIIETLRESFLIRFSKLVVGHI